MKRDSRTKKPEILHLNLFYRMNGTLYRDMKEILMTGYHTGFAGEIPDDLELLEFYEVLKLPVIQLVNPSKTRKPFIRLKIFCCSCVRGCKFLNLFTGEEWQFYIVNF
jgi:hypothetical protein